MHQNYILIKRLKCLYANYFREAKKQQQRAYNAMKNRDVNLSYLKHACQIVDLFIYFRTKDRQRRLLVIFRLSNVLIDVATFSVIGWGNSFTVVDVLKVPYLSQQRINQEQILKGGIKFQHKRHSSSAHVHIPWRIQKFGKGLALRYAECIIFVKYSINMYYKSISCSQKRGSLCTLQTPPSLSH